MKILILKPSSLGDIVQALPVLRLLKQHWPKSEIHWWIERQLSGLLEDDPDLAGLLLFDRHGWKSPRRWSQALASLRAMRERGFDLVLDLQGLWRSAIVAWLARGQFTAGVDDPREGGRAFYDLAVRRPGEDRHAVEWYLEVIRVLGVPVHDRFDWLPPRTEAAHFIRRKWPVDEHRWIVVQPGARWETKRWPAEHFAGAVERLARTLPDFQFAIMGSAADAEVASRIARGYPKRCLDLTGQTSLAEMIEWIRASELMLTNDTGPMHVAAALQRPVVALFGPTDPRRTGPYGQLRNVLQAHVPCAPCLRAYCTRDNYLECLQSLTPELVAHHVVDAL